MIHNKFKQNDNFFLDNQSIELFLAESILNHGKIAYFPSVEYEYSSVKKKLLKLVPNLNVIEFPDFDCSFFSNLSPTVKNKSKRISALFKLLTSSKSNTILLGTLESLIKKTIKIDDFRNKKLSLSKDCKLKYDDIIFFLKKYCYEKVDFVYNPGEYAIRGEIIDIFSPIHDFPVRILFDFDDIENLTLFTTEDQLTKNRVSSYVLFLSSEFQYNKSNIKCFRELFRKLNIKEKDDFYRSISDSQILPGSDQFFPILYKEFNSILSYLSDFKLIMNKDYEVDFEYSFNKVLDDFEEYKLFFKKDSDFLLKKEEFAMPGISIGY